MEHWVGFTGSYFSGLVREGILSRDRIFFKPGLNETILAMYNGIFDEVRSQRPLYQLKACVQIMGLIGETLSYERRLSQPNVYEDIVNRTKGLMESNIYGEINLSSISGQIGLSASRLNEVFKTYTSMTPYQYYIHIKIHKAESLLEQDMAVKEVAFRLGFEDQYYFSRLFKHKTGVSPLDAVVTRQARLAEVRSKCRPGSGILCRCSPRFPGIPC
ncbi:MAG: AraC family transcriptional regulator [Treponema sp.]|nr:AraC family transcriptional regulator [Treponema sp.]